MWSNLVTTHLPLFLLLTALGGWQEARVDRHFVRDLTWSHLVTLLLVLTALGEGQETRVERQSHLSATADLP